MPKQTENQFVVNLDGLKLTDEQRQRINSGIQKVVMTELAQLDHVSDFSVSKKGLVDSSKFSPLRPPICGIWWDGIANKVQLLSNVPSK